uniref:Calponin-homology (CH) domain-containing protein n=1 Tax=Arcella intermedia TaxID=1963864 RepID=A0A6B2L748_9EUKA
MADTLPEGFREELLGSLSFFEVMKSGVILCELLNTVAPGTIKQKPSKMNVPFKQMENIGYFLSGCKAVGIEDLFLFVTVDLFEGKQLGKVLDCLLEIQKKFAPEEYKKIVSDHSKASIIDIESTPTLPLPQAAPETSFLSPTKSQMDNSVNKVSTLDDDLEIKKQLKYNPKLAKAVTDWIEGLLHRNIGLPLGQALKSGVLLCQIINAIKTDIIPPSLIYEGNLAFRQRENIGYYLKAVRSMSIFKEHELFSTSDLFEEKNMNNVIVHLHALAKQCLNFEFYQGPTIEDTSRTGNILGAVLIGNEITIDEETLENWTEEEKVIIDWANSILPQEMTIKNVETLRSGEKIILLLKKLLRMTI